MTFDRTDLVDLLEELNHRTEGMDALDLRLMVEHVALKLRKEDADALPAPVRHTLFAVQAVVQAEREGWGDGVLIAPVKKTKRKRAKRYDLFPHVCVTRKEAEDLFDWLKKFGFRDPDAAWDKLSHDEKTDACEEAVERMVDIMLKEGQL